MFRRQILHIVYSNRCCCPNVLYYIMYIYRAKLTCLKHINMSCNVSVMDSLFILLFLSCCAVFSIRLEFMEHFETLTSARLTVSSSCFT